MGMVREDKIDAKPCHRSRTLSDLSFWASMRNINANSSRLTFKRARACGFDGMTNDTFDEPGTVRSCARCDQRMIADDNPSWIV